MSSSRSEGEGKVASSVQSRKSSLGTPLTLLDSVSKRSKDITATASLDVSDNPLITDDAFQAILGRCASLTSLSVAGCSELTDESIKAVAGCTSLTSLDVSGCGKLTDEALQAIAKNCMLTSVNVSGCRNLTDEAIKALASRSSLRSLNVAYCGKLLTDDSIKAVAASCPSLTSLNAADC
eukprot:6473639-Prymnesium_polylepis.1